MIELILGSPLRIRIVLTLWRFGELNATELAKRLGTNYRQLTAHIKTLAENGIVEERRIGRARLVKLRNTGFVEALATALAEAEEALLRRASA